MQTTVTAAPNPHDLLEEIREHFYLPKPPRLFDRWLIFPYCFNYELLDGKKPCLNATGITVQILTAIALFCNGNRNLTQYMIRRLNEWEEHFHFDRLYFIGESVAVRFTPEQSLEVQFPDNTQAAVFYFKLWHARQ